MVQKSNKKAFLWKRIIIAVVAVLVLGVITFGIINAIQNANIPEFDNGSELSAIELSTGGGVLLDWNYNFEDSEIAEVIDKTSKAVEDKEGGRVELKYIIKGKKPGKTKVTFNYGSAFDGQTIETRTYLIEVNRKLEVRITEQS